MGAFNGLSSFYDLFKGIVSGAIDVLPEESFLGYCKGNSTKIDTSLKALKDEFKDGDYEDGLTYFQKVLYYGSGITFNCYYSVKDPSANSGTDNGFGPTILMWNVLYNLGYMYSDGKAIYDYSKDSTDEWELIGERMGDFLIRFFVSRYVPRGSV